MLEVGLPKVNVFTGISRPFALIQVPDKALFNLLERGVLTVVNFNGRACLVEQTLLCGNLIYRR